MLGNKVYLIRPQLAGFFMRRKFQDFTCTMERTVALRRVNPNFPVELQNYSYMYHITTIIRNDEKSL